MEFDDAPGSGRIESKPQKMMMNLGRNTLYNPKKSTDLFDMFPAGDAAATQEAVAALVRPGGKSESRRGSSNS